ncbi:unnamed protein product [Closterium sp. NIES-53]
MTTPKVLAFEPDGRPIEFAEWLDDLQLFLLTNAKEGVSLFNYVSGTAVAPAADALALERSLWQTRDAAARLAIRNHLPIPERAHFSQDKIAKTLYDAVVARYSSPATAAIGRLMLPYLFPDLSLFTTAEDLISHLQATDTRFRAALSAEGTGSGGGGSSGGGGGGSGSGIGGQGQQQHQRQRQAPTSQQLVDWYAGRGASGVPGRCPYIIRTGPRAGRQCTGFHTEQRCFARLSVAWRAKFPDAPEFPNWADLLRRDVPIFDLDYEAILAAMYVLSVSGEGDCYLCVPLDPGIAPGIAPAALGACESAPLGTAPAQALHTFTLDSGASRCFFRDSTTVTPLTAPVPVSLADPSGGPVLARSSTVLPCPAVPSGELSGLYLPSFSTKLDAPLQTLHLDVWGPARVRGQGHEPYFLLVVDDYTRYTTVFPLQRKGDVPAVLIPWIRAARLQLRERFQSDFPVLRLHSDRGGEFSSDLLAASCAEHGIHQTFTLPASPQQNGVAERRIGLVMEVARTSMIHAAAPHFLWPFAVRYAAHQLKLWPRVSLPETSPTLLWTGKVGNVSRFRVWGARAFVRDTTADKLSPCAIPCVFLGFVPDAPGWQVYDPASRRVFASQDVTFDDSVPFYHLFPYRTAPRPPSLLFLAPGPPQVDPLPAPGPAPSGVSQVDPPAPAPVEVTGDSGPAASGAVPRGAELGGAESGGAERVEPGGAEPAREEPGGAACGGAARGGF